MGIANLYVPAIVNVGFSIPYLLSETTVSGAAVTAVDFSGLDLLPGTLNDPDKVEFTLNILLVNPIAAGANYSIFVNGDYVAGNYYNQELNAVGAAAGAMRSNNANFAYVSASSSSNYKAFFARDRAGRFRCFAEGAYDSAGSTALKLRYTVKSATITKITDIRVSCDTASGIGIGSVITLGVARSRQVV